MGQESSDRSRCTDSLVYSDGNNLAQAPRIFAGMNAQEPCFIAPLPSEIPDYVWAPRYDSHYLQKPGSSFTREPEEGQRISHPDAESALRAAKRACRSSPGRWIGRDYSTREHAAFLVYEGGKVIERHSVN